MGKPVLRARGRADATYAALRKRHPAGLRFARRTTGWRLGLRIGGAPLVDRTSQGLRRRLFRAVDRRCEGDVAEPLRLPGAVLCECRLGP